MGTFLPPHSHLYDRTFKTMIALKLVLGSSAVALLALTPSAISPKLPAQQTSVPPQSPAIPQLIIDEAAELFIRDIGVVDDPRAYNGGAWSFGALMTHLSGSIDPDRFVEDWITTLTDRQIVNGDISMQNAAGITNKEQVFKDFFDAWRDESTGLHVDLDRAPFRLLAIVNRPDLLQVDGTLVESAGEARFIFAAVDPTTENVEDALPLPGPNRAAGFFVIFEYGIPAASCADLRDWQEQWHDLAQHPSEPLGSEAYNVRLQAITDSFTQPDVSSQKPNMTLLNQLRTNEFELDTGSLLWDLREWNVVDAFGNPMLGVLRNVTTKQTPGFRYIKNSNRLADLADWLSLPATKAAILDGTHVVPDSHPLTGAGFAGGLAVNEQQQHILPPDLQPQQGTLVEFGPSVWWATGFAGDTGATPPRYVSETDALVRHGFALQTCAGCHGWESGTDDVVQDPVTGRTQKFSMTTAREHGQETKLSPFLTGTELFPDKVNPYALDANGALVPVDHRFNDLERREGVMSRILQLNCASGATAAELSSIAPAMGNRVH